MINNQEDINRVSLPSESLNNDNNNEESMELSSDSVFLTKEKNREDKRKTDSVRYILHCNNVFYEMITNNFMSKQYAISIIHKSSEFIKKQTVFDMETFDLIKHYESLTLVHSVLDQAKRIYNLDKSRNFCLIVKKVIIIVNDKDMNIFITLEDIEISKIFCIKNEVSQVDDLIMEKQKLLHEIYTQVMDKVNEYSSLKNQFNKTLEHLKNYILRLEADKNFKIVFLYKNKLETDLLQFERLVNDLQQSSENNILLQFELKKIVNFKLIDEK